MSTICSMSLVICEATGFWNKIWLVHKTQPEENQQGACAAWPMPIHALKWKPQAWWLAHVHVKVDFKTRQNPRVSAVFTRTPLHDPDPVALQHEDVLSSSHAAGENSRQASGSTTLSRCWSDCAMEYLQVCCVREASQYVWAESVMASDFQKLHTRPHSVGELYRRIGLWGSPSRLLLSSQCLAVSERMTNSGHVSWLADLVGLQQAPDIRRVFLETPAGWQINLAFSAISYNSCRRCCWGFVVFSL